ncbi:sensor domain-containing protein [Rhizobium paknamense]|uniref:Diguanylate cyclase (GGDEF)-like protein n=1 Tax=Rhizobium paknamense TaxID=1206817 RepID=A0ABU0IA17_9HYPH|nr:GGDEF domain-containing phosphodiesterase [Rhizobium paknamense]MDQ0455071.1 diguanylate cyclase (GGDEF)-like protein [Rhizobium paknamense]
MWLEHFFKSTGEKAAAERARPGFLLGLGVIFLLVLALPFAVGTSTAMAGDGIGTLLAVAAALLFLQWQRKTFERQFAAQEERHRELSQRFDLAMDSSNIGIWELDPATGALIHDGRATRLHGRQAATLASREDWLASIHPQDREKAEVYLFRCASMKTGQTSETYRVQSLNGELRYLRSVGAHSPSSNRITGVIFDVTADIAMQNNLRSAKEVSDIKNAELELALDELSLREQELEELSHRFELALASYNCGVWEHDFIRGHRIWDERMCQLYDLPRLDGHVSDARWLKNVHRADRPRLQAAADRATAQMARLDDTHRVQFSDGSVRHIRIVGRVHNARDGRCKLIGVAFDVTADVMLTEELRKAKGEAEARAIELELAKNRIEYNALHDPLTGLSNRRRLDLELDMLSASADRTQPDYTILHLDLDRFKDINDTLGHAAGDAMLAQAARVLTRHVAAGDLTARIGGDEFVILLKRPVDDQALALMAGRIIEEINTPIQFEGTPCRCGVSIGIARSGTAGTEARKILINADLALYEAKRKGRNAFEFFSDQLQSNIVSTKRMADDLLSALERDELTVWYQPQFCTNSMQLAGAEALVRWNHPEKGIMATNSFLKIAEDLNLMGRIDQMVLEQALKDKMRWAAQGLKVPRISVNVSSKRLYDENLIQTLESLSITPGEIAFELVESIFLDEADDRLGGNIERLKALGIEIEVDDFGTGHTSIISLLKLKPKRLKIDRQLVQPVVTAPREQALIRSIIDIARSLGVETVAEGVETLDHADILRQLGCDLLQGYAFAKPLPYADFARFVAERTGAAETMELQA